VLNGIVTLLCCYVVVFGEKNALNYSGKMQVIHFVSFCAHGIQKLS